MMATGATYQVDQVGIFDARSRKVADALGPG